VSVCDQGDSDGIIHRYCPAHLEDSELKPNITCAVYNHDGTGITTWCCSIWSRFCDCCTTFSTDNLYDCTWYVCVQRCWLHTTMKTFTCLTVHYLTRSAQRSCIVTLDTETMLQVVTSLY